MAILIAFVTSFLDTGCSTVTPNVISDDQASFDDTTPREYNNQNSGYIGYVNSPDPKATGAIITLNAKERYNNLIIHYALQMFENESIKLKENDGIEPYKDIYGNDLFIIHPQHLAYFMKMNRWKKEGRDPDSLWMKTKNIIN